MCTKAEFARVRDMAKEASRQSAENSKQIAELQKTDAVQSEQLKTLRETTEKQGENQKTLLDRLVMAIIGILVLVVLALIFGALGKDGFNGVVKAAPSLRISSGEVPEGE